MMARNATVPLTGRIQKRKTNHLQIVIFGLQRAAGPYRWAKNGLMRCGNTSTRQGSLLLDLNGSSVGIGSAGKDHEVATRGLVLATY